MKRPTKQQQIDALERAIRALETNGTKRDTKAASILNEIAELIGADLYNVEG
ncbi:MAG: hypothetical protein V4498_00575 [candidate division FCPU426 bacterium]